MRPQLPPKPLDESLICRGVSFVPFGWRWLILGGVQPVAGTFSGTFGESVRGRRGIVPRSYDGTGAAFDPEHGRLYVPSLTLPAVIRVFPPPAVASPDRYAGMWRVLFGPGGLPLTKPPYGRITAIDLNTGEHAWMVPHGEGPRADPLLEPLNPAAARLESFRRCTRDADVALRGAEGSRGRHSPGEGSP